MDKELEDQALAKDNTRHSEEKKSSNQDGVNEEPTKSLTETTETRGSEIVIVENLTQQDKLTTGVDTSAQQTKVPEINDVTTPPTKNQRNEGVNTDMSTKDKQPKDKTPKKSRNRVNKRKKKPSKKKKKQKQNHILEAGPNGREQLAGSSQAPEDAEDDKDKEEEVVKDKAYYDKVVSARKREFTFRINFILLLTDPTGTLEEKKSKALTQLKEEVKPFHLLDPLWYLTHGGTALLLSHPHSRWKTLTKIQLFTATAKLCILALTPQRMQDLTCTSARLCTLKYERKN